jgi:hypothetical protein
MIKLFLDDERVPLDCYSYMQKRDSELCHHYKENDWIILRNHDQFIDWIIKNGLPDLISFDHDLVHEHYSPLCHIPKQYNKLYMTFKQKTGLHSARWLLIYCSRNNLKIPRYMVHTMNPTGHDNIHLMLNKVLD